MSLMSLLGGALSVAQTIFCATYSKQSTVNLSLGILGPVTAGQPIYINNQVSNSEQVITNLKVNFRTNGVSVPAIENMILAANTQSTSVAGFLPNTSEVAAYLNQNATLAVPTIYAWAIIVVRQDPTVPSYPMTPYADFDFTMLPDLLSRSMPPGYANSTTKPNIIVYMDYSILYGHQTYRDFQVGFKNSNYPGAIRLGPGDYLQLITFASGNFDNPMNSFAGVWARLCGQISFEILPPYSPDLTDEQLTIDGRDSVYKLFERR